VRLDPGQGRVYIAPAMPVLRFIEPCLPSPADRPPSGPGWLHEIKHDGYRLMARRDSGGHAQGQRLDDPLPSDPGRSPDWLKDEEPGGACGEA
jgi:hypothetical protein